MKNTFRPTLESMESRENPSAVFNGHNDVGVVLSNAAQVAQPLGEMVAGIATSGPGALAAAIHGIEVGPG